MKNEELTSDEVRGWFQNALYNVNSWQAPNTMSELGRMISKEQVFAYVQKLEQRVIRLAAKLADQA